MNRSASAYVPPVGADNVEGGQGMDRRWRRTFAIGVVAAGRFDELVRAIRSGTTYVNVHSTLYPGGEIRAQLGDHSH